MKITLSQAEALRFATTYLQSIHGRHVIVVLESVEGSRSMNDAYPYGLIQAAREYPLHTSTQKISFVKRARILVPGLSLGDAKTAAENLPYAIDYYMSTGNCLPYTFGH